MAVVEPEDQSWGAPTRVTGLLSLNESMAVASLTGKTTEIPQDGVPWFKQVACKNLLEIVERNARVHNHPSSALIEEDQAQRLASRKPTADSAAACHSGTNVTAPSQGKLVQTAAFDTSPAAEKYHSVGLSTGLETPPNQTRDAMEITCGTGAQESACTTFEFSKPPKRLSALRSLMRLRTNSAEDCEEEQETCLNEEFPTKVKRKKHRPKVKRDASRPRKRRGPSNNKEKERSSVSGLQDVVEEWIRLMKTAQELQQGHQAFETTISYEHEHLPQIEAQQGCKENSITVENISHLHNAIVNILTYCDDRAVLNSDGATASSVLSFHRPDEEFTRGTFLQGTKDLNFLWQGHHDTHQHQLRTAGNLVGKQSILQSFLSQDDRENQQSRDGKPFLYDFFGPSPHPHERPVPADLDKPPEGHELTLYVQCPDQWETPYSYKSKLPQYLAASPTALSQLTLTEGNSTELTLARGNAQPDEKLQMILYNQKKDVVLSRLRKRPKKLRAKINVDPESLREWHLLENGELPQKHEDLERKKGWESERAAMASRVDAFIKTMHEVQGDRRFSHWKGSIVDSVVGAFLTQNVSDHLSSSAFMSIASHFRVVPRKDIIDPCSAERHESSHGLQHDTEGPSLLMGRPLTVIPEEQRLEKNRGINMDPQIQDIERTNVKNGHGDFVDPSEFIHSSQQLSSQFCDDERNSHIAIEDCPNLSLNTPGLPFPQNKGPSTNVEDGHSDFIGSSESVHSIQPLISQICDDERNSHTAIETCPNLSLETPDPPLLKNKGPSTEDEDCHCGFMYPSGSVHSGQQPSFQLRANERNSRSAIEDCTHNPLNTPGPPLLEDKGPSTEVEDGNCNFMDRSESVHSSQRPSFQFCDDERNSPTAIEDCSNASLNTPDLALLKNKGPSTKVEDRHCDFMDPFESAQSSQQPSSHFFDDERNSGTDIEDCPNASLSTPDTPFPKNNTANYLVSDDERNSSTSVEDDLGGDSVTPRNSWGAFGTRSMVYSRPKVCRKLNFENEAVAGNEELQIIPISESCCEAKSTHNHVKEVGSEILIDRQSESQAGMELFHIPESRHVVDFQPETVQESSQGSNFQVNTVQDTVPFLVRKTGKKRPLSISSISGIERAQLEANQKGRKKNHHQDWESVRRHILENCSKNKEDSGMQQEFIQKEKDSVNWDAVRVAGLGELAETIKERGMHHVLSGRIKAFLTSLYEEHGSIDLEWIRDLSPEKAREYLMSIHGLGVKSVECIRLLTLHHLAFPVDTNVGRICVRLGWVPIEPLPEELQLHLLELYPVQESIQKYLWPRLCTLKQETLYELHYQLITFGKVFCTKSKPNCNACPMRRDCKHFASAFASAKPLLTGPAEGKTGRICTGPSIEALPAAEMDRKEMGLIDYPAYNCKQLSFSEEAVHVTEVDVGRAYPLGCCGSAQTGIERNFECIIEEPASPEPAHIDDLMDIEDFGEKQTYIYDRLSDYSEELLAESLHCRCLSDQESSSNHDIKSDDNQLSLSTSPPLNVSLSGKNLSCCASQCSSLGEKASYESQMVVSPPTPSKECQHTVSGTTPEQPPCCSDIIADITSNAIVSLPPEAAQIPVPKLKNVGRLRTVHFVYELPDNHPLLAQMGMDAREHDDPCYYLLAIWSPGEIPESQQEINDLCTESSCASACGSTWEADEKVAGTLLIPCRTAMHGSFPLNGTYFQVNEVFADHESSQHPIQVPRCLIWNLRRRFVYFGTSVPNIFRGLSTPEIRNCFWLGYVCVRGFDRGTRAPKPLVCRLHFPISKQEKTKKRAGEEV